MNTRTIAILIISTSVCIVQPQVMSMMVVWKAGHASVFESDNSKKKKCWRSGDMVIALGGLPRRRYAPAFRAARENFMSGFLRRSGGPIQA